MSRSRRWKVYAAAGLAALTLTGAGAALASLAGSPSPLDFAERHDRQAYAILTSAADAASLDAAEREVRRALALSPYSNSARLRLTYIDTVRRGSLGPAGMAQLSRSYDLVPLDHTVAAWRVRFALEHWDELSPALRKSVEAEAMAFGRTGSRDADVKASLAAVQNPEGRLAAALWLRGVDRPRYPQSPPET